MILIVASKADGHLRFVTEKLDERGVDHFQFDPSDFPAAAEVVAAYDRKGTRSLRLCCRERQVELESVRAVWDRGETQPIPARQVQAEHASWVSEYCSRFLAELFECIEGFWVPERPSSQPPDRRDFPGLSQGASPHPLPVPSPYNKMHQLHIAGSLGFRVPRTVITNSPGRALDFVEDCEGQAISKRAADLVIYRLGELRKTYTATVGRRDVARYQQVRYAPVTFQEKIPKKLEVRATVVGRRVFAAEIRSSDDPRLESDWRHHGAPALGERCGVHRLPPEIARRCVAMVRTLGLCFGALDLILTPEDDYVFLEVNPHGSWMWIEEFTGLPISAAIADMLIAGRG